MNKIDKLKKLMEDDNTFTTQVELTLFSGDLVDLGLIKNEEEYDTVDTKEVIIKWSAELEYRDWGVKDVNISVPDQQIEISYGRIINDDGDIETLERTINVTDITINSNNSNIPLYPKELQYDVKKKIWTLEF